MSSPWLAAGAPVLPGMLLRTSFLYEPGKPRFGRVVDASPSFPGVTLYVPGVGLSGLAAGDTLVEDDGATLGAMLGEVRRVHKDHYVYYTAAPDEEDERCCSWIVWVPGLYGGRNIGCGGTLVEALVAAWRARV